MSHEDAVILVKNEVAFTRQLTQSGSHLVEGEGQGSDEVFRAERPTGICKGAVDGQSDSFQIRSTARGKSVHALH